MLEFGGRRTWVGSGLAFAALAAAVALVKGLRTSAPDDGYGEPNGGLILSLSLPRTVVHVGEAIPARVAARDLGTRRPVAATLCSGFGFSYEHLETGGVGASGQPPAACEADPFRDVDRAFQTGETLTTRTPDTGLTLKPGRYLVMAYWNAHLVGDRSPLPHSSYADVGSNAIAVTVLAR